VYLALFLGGALVVALVFERPLQQLLEWASSNFFRA
jgi:hypothetical protein